MPLIAIYSNYKYICVKYPSIFPVNGLIFWAEPCVFPSADILLKRLLLWTAAAGTPKSSNVCRNFSGGKQWFGWHHVWATPRKMHFQPMHFHDAGVTQWHIKICNLFRGRTLKSQWLCFWNLRFNPSLANFPEESSSKAFRSHFREVSLVGFRGAIVTPRKFSCASRKHLAVYQALKFNKFSSCSKGLERYKVVPP